MVLGLIKGDAELGKDARGDAVRDGQHAAEDVLVVDGLSVGVVDGVGQCHFGAGTNAEASSLRAFQGALPERLLELVTDTVQVDPESR